MANERLIFGLARRHYEDMAQIFRRFPRIERVLIFGSRAKGTDKPWSDFDLAVIAPTLSDSDFSRLWNEIDDLPLAFKLDLLHWDKLGEIPLKEKIIREGLLFYPFPEVGGDTVAQ